MLGARLSLLPQKIGVRESGASRCVAAISPFAVAYRDSSGARCLRAYIVPAP